MVSFRLQTKSLQQRITFFVLVPLCLLMMIMGLAGFLFARDIMLHQWGETAIANLQKAAHKIDMRLNRPKEMLLLIHNESGSDETHLVHEFIVQQLKKMDGIVGINVQWPGISPKEPISKRMGQGRFRRMKYSRMSRLKTSLPEFNPLFKSETVSISSDFIDAEGRRAGGIEVVIGFHDLVDQILDEPWWQSNKAFIIDNTGTVLSSSLIKGDTHIHQKQEKFGHVDPLEIKTLEMIQEKSHGVVFGRGHPPDEISGFYHLTEAPWSIVISAPGKMVLESLIKFRTYYFLFTAVFIFMTILFIRSVLNRTKDAIKQVSDAAEDIARGTFGSELIVHSQDEVGVLTENFNKMSRQLQERLKLKSEINLAKEIQQSLLPQPYYCGSSFEVSGTTIYCDETGGDYFDLIQFSDSKDKMCVIVGDVVGHGVGAALFMTTTRALLRSSLANNESLADALTDVNRLICHDTNTTGSFITLFAMMIDANKGEIRWVRAGHDPAMLYDPDEKKVSELKGEGIALGLDENFHYVENSCGHISPGTICLVATDGLWETENSENQRFGKNRVENILKSNEFASSDDIVNMIISDIESFRGDVQQSDDISLAAVRFLEGANPKKTA